MLALRANGAVTDSAVAATTVQPWLAWSMEANATGQIVHEWNPDGAAFTGAVAGAQAVAADLTYSYDPAGRLTKVVDRSDEADGTGCRLRTYRFDARGNRLADTTAAATTGAPCPTTPGVGTSHSYDTADRPITAGDNTAYTYDALGRQTLIPAADAPRPESGDVRLSYYDDDTAKAITQAGMSLSYALDVAGRRTVQTTRRTLEAAVTESVTNHYVDGSDDPGWVTTVTADTTSTTAYADLTSGGLSLSITTTGEATSGELALANPRGDVSASITLPADGEAVQGLDRWTRYTEYGTPVVTPPTGTGGAAANGYGWLGAKQRTTTETGILLMGARLYNPVTGLFTSLDPVHGGNDTPYAYPNDPFNQQDITGQWAHVVIRGAIWAYLAYRAYQAVSSAARNARKPLKAQARTYSQKTHQPIARAGMTRSTLRRKPRYLYEIYYRSNGREYTYKYGITSVPGGVRQRAMASECGRDTRKPGKCKYRDRGTRPNYHQARLWEEQILRDYARRNGGHCPLWHRGKRVCK